MEIDELKEKLNTLDIKFNKLIHTVKLKDKKNQLETLEKLTYESDFYSNTEKSAKVLNEIKNLNMVITKYLKLQSLIDDIKTYFELYLEEKDDSLIIEIKKILPEILEKLEKYEIDVLLSGEYDNNNAIVTIHPGAGGTESQDWGQMLFRMYNKWADSNEFGFEILDYQDGEEAGIKSVTFLVKGLNSYGYLKTEKGVHRLVRISPFDSNSRRHTSFASVEVMPEIDDNIEVNIDSDDLDVGTFRASGAGGQHVNKTDSAIRIKHIPTGIVVSCQTERSQIQNRENAMKMLRSKLYEYELKLKKEKESNIKGEVLDNSWGSQIRSYVFCPYTLVKDHRTGFEKGNVNSVMDGKIDEFMYEYLKYINNNDII